MSEHWLAREMKEAQFHAEAAAVYDRIQYTLPGPEGLGLAYEIVAERWERSADPETERRAG